MVRRAEKIIQGPGGIAYNEKPKEGNLLGLLRRCVGNLSILSVCQCWERASVIRELVNGVHRDLTGANG